MRIIIHDDSLNWLKNQPDETVPNFITGICDLDETSMEMEKYLAICKEVTGLILRKLHPKGYAIFIQTDRKYQRQWIDKSFLISQIAADLGLKMIWHKIVLQREPDRTDLHRPTYSHMLCYSREGTTGAATPDVLPVGKKLYKNATPLNAAETAVQFVKRYNKANTAVVDPFTGYGTIPAMANKHGLKAVGIDLDPEMVSKAETLTLS